MPRNYLANSDLQLQPVPYGEAPLTVCRWPEPDYVLPQKMPKAWLYRIQSLNLQTHTCPLFSTAVIDIETLSLLDVAVT
jgi:hypothetical protein